MDHSADDVGGGAAAAAAAAAVAAAVPILQSEYLVFSGGGVKGIAFAGVIEALEESACRTDGTGFLAGIKGYGGSSAGALFATLLALGCLPATLRAIVCEPDDAGGGWMRVRAPHTRLDNLALEFGVDDGALLRNFVATLIGHNLPAALSERAAAASGGGAASVTFGDLHAATGRALRIVASDVVAGAPFIFDHRATPHAPVVDAVVASMSVPWVFQPVRLAGMLLVDGGWYDNFPLALFPRHLTLGIMLETESSTAVETFMEYNLRLVFTLHERAQEAMLQRDHGAWMHRILRVRTAPVALLDMDPSPDRRRALMEQGRACALAFVQDRNRTDWGHFIALLEGLQAAHRRAAPAAAPAAALQAPHACGGI
jgi:NTE family protein